MSGVSSPHASGEQNPATIEYPTETFPAYNFPTVFADGVLNATISRWTVKYYLFRLEPSLKADNKFLAQAVAQVVLPVEGFVSAYLYFEKQVNRMIDTGIITKARVDEMRGAADESGT